VFAVVATASRRSLSPAVASDTPASTASEDIGSTVAARNEVTKSPARAAASMRQRRLNQNAIGFSLSPASPMSRQEKLATKAGSLA
jgi:hypothetical protein